MSQITSHVLDTTKGTPVAGIFITLSILENRVPKILASGTTNENGRVPDLLAADLVLLPGSYKLTFDTGQYFKSLEYPVFYPFVEIHFIVADGLHYHIPLLLSPFGYTTYRGS